MRKLRELAGRDVKVAVYEVGSNVVDDQAIMGPKEKRFFLALVRAHARFGGLTVLKCSVLKDSFHLLVAVPRRPVVFPVDAELLSRMEAIFKPREVSRVQSQLEEMRSANDHAKAEALRKTYFRRMWDLSDFVKAIKQRFTQWFNSRNRRRGVLWSERFRSALLEQSERVRAMPDPIPCKGALPWPGLLARFTRPGFRSRASARARPPNASAASLPESLRKPRRP